MSGSPQLVAKIGTYFYEETKKLLNENSYAFVGGKKRGIDLIRMVTQVVPTTWLADLVWFFSYPDEVPY